jgi:hypothetical protein
MSPAGVAVAIIGVLLICQVTGGQALERLNAFKSIGAALPS